MNKDIEAIISELLGKCSLALSNNDLDQVEALQKEIFKLIQWATK